MRRLLLSLPLCAACMPASVAAQEYHSVSVQEPLSVSDNLTVTSATVSSHASHVEVADPNERLAVNGRVVRMADLIPALSSSDSSQDSISVTRRRVVMHNFSQVCRRRKIGRNVGLGNPRTHALPL